MRDKYGQVLVEGHFYWVTLFDTKEPTIGQWMCSADGKFYSFMVVGSEVIYGYKDVYDIAPVVPWR